MNKDITDKILLEYGAKKNLELKEIIKSKEDEIESLKKQLENSRGACQRLKNKIKLMNRKEQIKAAAENYVSKIEDIDDSLYSAFCDGAEWADKRWIKFSEELPPKGELLVIASRNKNKEDGIWLYEVCEYTGGDYKNNINWEGKNNWETPIYWKPLFIEELEKNVK